jgi:hypothetical protein
LWPAQGRVGGCGKSEGLIFKVYYHLFLGNIQHFWGDLCGMGLFSLSIFQYVNFSRVFLAYAKANNNIVLKIISELLPELLPKLVQLAPVQPVHSDVLEIPRANIPKIECPKTRA